MRIDLHVHSTASDGTNLPSEVVRRADAAGVTVFALTDHDTTAGWDEARSALLPGMTLVPGAELSCATEVGGERVSLHVLGYLFDPGEPEFARERALLRESRLHRAERMVDRLRELGVDVTWERVRAIAAGGAVGRPHVAEAMIEAGAVGSIAEAFGRDWLGHGGRAYVPRYELDPLRAIALVRAAGGVAVFAHPLARKRGPVVGEDVIEAMAAAGLAGLEVDHPDHDAEARRRLRELAAALGLAVTGSSDDHGERTGHRLGCESTARADYERLVAQAAYASPVTAC